MCRVSDNPSVSYTFSLLMCQTRASKRPPCFEALTKQSANSNTPLTTSCAFLKGTHCKHLHHGEFKWHEFNLFEPTLRNRLCSCCRTWWCQHSLRGTVPRQLWEFFIVLSTLNIKTIWTWSLSVFEFTNLPNVLLLSESHFDFDFNEELVHIYGRTFTELCFSGTRAILAIN